MSDDLDIAAERTEIARQAALSRRKPTGPEPTGRCLYCDEIVADGKRWCPGADCRDGFELEQRRLRANREVE